MCQDQIYAAESPTSEPSNAVCAPLLPCAAICGSPRSAAPGCPWCPWPVPALFRDVEARGLVCQARQYSCPSRGALAAVSLGVVCAPRVAAPPPPCAAPAPVGYAPPPRGPSSAPSARRAHTRFVPQHILLVEAIAMRVPEAPRIQARQLLSAWARLAQPPEPGHARVTLAAHGCCSTDLYHAQHHRARFAQMQPLPYRYRNRLARSTVACPGRVSGAVGRRVSALEACAILARSTAFARRRGGERYTTWSPRARTIWSVASFALASTHGALE